LEHELGLGKPTHDTPPAVVPATSGNASTIMHAASYKPQGFFAIHLVTLTRVSPDGKSFFGVYASADQQNLDAGLSTVIKQFEDWHSVSADALPHPPQTQSTDSVWGSGLLGMAYQRSPSGQGAQEERIATMTKALLSRLAGTYSGRSKATIRRYSNGGAMNQSIDSLATEMDEGPATLRIRADGTYTMHSDWTFSGCRVVRDHDGKVSLIGDPEPQSIRLQAAHFVEHSSCKEGTNTKAPSMQYGLVWSGTGPAKSLPLTRHEDGDSPNTRHDMILERQAGQ
jgi:hypothetical protein